MPLPPAVGAEVIALREAMRRMLNTHDRDVDGGGHGDGASGRSDKSKDFKCEVLLTDSPDLAQGRLFAPQSDAYAGFTHDTTRKPQVDNLLHPDTPIGVAFDQWRALDLKLGMPAHFVAHGELVSVDFARM